MTKPRLRQLLISTMAIGFILMPIAPIARVMNEGFGDDPGPVHVSRRLQQASYGLISLGIVLIVSAGIALVIVDRRT